MKINNKKYISGESIQSISLSNKSIKIELVNGEKIVCKPIGSMNLASWIDYSDNTENL